MPLLIVCVSQNKANEVPVFLTRIEVYLLGFATFLSTEIQSSWTCSWPENSRHKRAWLTEGFTLLINKSGWNFSHVRGFVLGTLDIWVKLKMSTWQLFKQKKVPLNLQFQLLEHWYRFESTFISFESLELQPSQSTTLLLPGGDERCFFLHLVFERRQNSWELKLGFKHVWTFFYVWTSFNTIFQRDLFHMCIMKITLLVWNAPKFTFSSPKRLTVYQNKE